MTDKQTGILENQYEYERLAKGLLLSDICNYSFCFSDGGDTIGRFFLFGF